MAEDRGTIAVVGAGIAGLSTAWHLAADHRVIVLEQGAQPGAEATAQNAAMVRRLIHDPYERRLALRAARFYDEPGPDWQGLTPSRRTGAVLGLVYDPYHLHDAVADARATGVRIEALEADDVGRAAPVLSGTRLARAWYLPDERVADPHALLTGLLRGLRRAGAELRCDARVLGLRVEGGRVAGVRTRHGVVGADAVVLAAGAWSGMLAAQAGLSRPLMVLRRTLLQSEPHALAGRDHPWCWIDDAGVYARPEAGGWLCSPCDETLDHPCTGPGSRGPSRPLAIALCADKLERHLPALRKLRWRGGWTGLRTFAPDRLPLLGKDHELPGLWWATALGGFGITCGVAAGEAVATWMRGGTTDWLVREAVAPGRPPMSRVPIYPDGDLNHARLVEIGDPPGPHAPVGGAARRAPARVESDPDADYDRLERRVAGLGHGVRQHQDVARLSGSPGLPAPGSKTPLHPALLVELPRPDATGTGTAGLLGHPHDLLLGHIADGELTAN